MSENDVSITYERIYEILRKEKESGDILKLDPTFYGDVVGYLAEKTKILDEAAHKTDLFSAAERENTSLQLKNIKRLLKELYDRRESKILSLAMNKSRTDSDIINTASLLPEERAMYQQLVDSLSMFRKGIHDHIVESRMPFIPGVEVIAEPTSYSRLQGRDSVRDEQEPHVKVPELHAKAEPPKAVPPVSTPVPTTKTPPASSPATPSIAPSPATPQVTPPKETAAKPGIENKPNNSLTIKFLQQTSKFVGKELEVYGPFIPGDISTLPSDIARVLITRGSAQEV